MFIAELDYARTQGDIFLQLINLYKAMGGGWVDEAGKLAAPPTVDINRTPSPFP